MGGMTAPSPPGLRVTTHAPPPDDYQWIGASPRRREDHHLVTGQGQYRDDLRPRSMLAVGFVRSPRAHARLVRVRTEGARQFPGVVAVLTHADIPELAVPLPAVFVGPADVKPCRPLPIASDRVRYVGEIVAVVVAE
jgi:carbon-monoxide dehydrogenase large subunit